MTEGQMVDFFVVGVQKGGTTALDRMLRSHPQVQMSVVKEVHHFDDETIDWVSPCHEKLHRQFDWSIDEIMRGEATPIYTYWPDALDRLATYNHHAKIVVCLRHPALRAHSQWRMETKRGSDDVPFSVAIREGRNRVLETPSGAHRVYSYVERGFYADQIRRLKSLFGCVHILRTDLLWLRHDVELARLCAFLGIDPYSAPDGYVSPVDTSGLEAITPIDRQYLQDLYAEDIAETARLTGLDLDDWLDPAYEEPMRTSLRREDHVGVGADCR